MRIYLNASQCRKKVMMIVRFNWSEIQSNRYSKKKKSFFSSSTVLKMGKKSKQSYILTCHQPARLCFFYPSNQIEVIWHFVFIVVLRETRRRRKKKILIFFRFFSKKFRRSVWNSFWNRDEFWKWIEIFYIWLSISDDCCATIEITDLRFSWQGLCYLAWWLFFSQVEIFFSFLFCKGRWKTSARRYFSPIFFQSRLPSICALLLLKNIGWKTNIDVVNTTTASLA